MNKLNTKQTVQVSIVSTNLGAWFVDVYVNGRLKWTKVATKSEQVEAIVKQVNQFIQASVQ